MPTWLEANTLRDCELSRRIHGLPPPGRSEPERVVPNAGTRRARLAFGICSVYHATSLVRFQP